MTQTVLVTGGSGYIGTLVCMDLVDKGYDVINIDRVKKDIPGVTQYPFDINNHQVDGLLQIIKPDSIIHLAADHNIRESSDNPSVFYENNVANTVLLLNSAVQAGVKNFVFSSSSSVYGDAQVIPTPETQPTAPQSAYAQSKKMVEDMLPDYHRAYGLNYVVLRYFNAAGADLDRKHGYTQEPKTHLVPIVAQSLVQGTTVEIFGSDHNTDDGFCERDYTHVLDVSSAHLSALKYLENGGPADVFNIGTGTATSVMRLIRKANLLITDPVSFEIVETHAEEVDKTCADISKATSILGWAPKYNLEDILKDAYEWEKSRKKSK